jgi:hypothetical protein
MTKFVPVTWVLLVVACGNGSSSNATGSAAAPAGGSASGSSSVIGAGSARPAGTAGSGSAGGSGDASSAGSTSGSAAAGSGSGSGRDSRCGEPCLFLADTALASVASAYRAACGDAASPDLNDCAVADYARNCIYAAHGAPFKKPKWKQAFAGKIWYRPDPGVNANQLVLADVERANVKALVARAKTCRAVRISTADAARVRAWFAALPKVPASPAIAFDDGSGAHFVDGKQLLAALGKLARPIRASIRASKHMSAEYVKTPVVKPTLTTTSHEVREILLEVTVPGRTPPGIAAELLYDGDDKLIGANVQLLTEEDLSD